MWRFNMHPNTSAYAAGFGMPCTEFQYTQKEKRKVKFMRKKQFTALLFAAMLTIGSLAGCQKQAANNPEQTKTSVETGKYTADDLDGIVEFASIYILKDSKNVNYLFGTEYDKDIVKDIKADSDKVNLKKAGKYDITYTVTVYDDLMDAYLEGKDAKTDKTSEEDSKDTAKDTSDIQVAAKVEVVTEDTAKTLANAGKSVQIGKGNVYTADASETDENSDADSDKDSGNSESNSLQASNTGNKGDDNKNTGSSGNKNNNSGNQNNGNSGNSGSGNKNGNGSSNNSSGNSGGSNNSSSGNSDNSGNSGGSNNGNSGNGGGSGNNGGSGNGDGSGNNNGGSESSKPTPSHKHSYTSKVTKAATCVTAGVKTYTCSCGDSYTESIPATGNHSWVDDDPVWVIDREWYEDVWKGNYDVWVCYCGQEFYSADAISDHQKSKILAGESGHGGSYVDTRGRYETEHKTEGHYEYPKHCSVCGLIK